MWGRNAVHNSWLDLQLKERNSFKDIKESDFNIFKLSCGNFSNGLH